MEVSLVFIGQSTKLKFVVKLPNFMSTECTTPIVEYFHRILPAIPPTTKCELYTSQESLTSSAA